VLQLNDVTFHYRGSRYRGSEAGQFRLCLDNLTIADGEALAIVGPSGSGKTTLLNLIAGIYLPDTGSIRHGELEITKLNESRRRDYRITHMGMVFQSFELLEYLTVLDNILLPTRISGALRLADQIKERARELAVRVGIGDKLNRPITRLSQGERQRVAVCRALLMEPELLLADEPTGNLDPRNKGRVLEILLDYVEQRNVTQRNVEQRKATLITVTHDQTLLDRFSRVIDFQQLNPAGEPA